MATIHYAEKKMLKKNWSNTVEMTLILGKKVVLEIRE